MTLHESPEFRDALIAAGERLHLPAQFIEKDYYVTEILRVVADLHGERLIFKGGTSLMKGWRLIDRYSEDIDLFFDPEAFDPPLRRRAIDRELRKLREAVESQPHLTFDPALSNTVKGLGRADHFTYVSIVSNPILPVEPAVRVEPGIQSGRQPTEVRRISSLLVNFLIEGGNADLTRGHETFPMTLLHFRRTFVEKLFAIHGKIERLKHEGHPLGRDARHYADLYVLAGQAEVVKMLDSDEYGEIRRDYDLRSREFFARSYRPPPDLRFNTSAAIFPPAELRKRIENDYETECRRLFPQETSYPSFDEVLARLAGLAEIL